MSIVYFLPVEVEHRGFCSKLLLSLKLLSSRQSRHVVIGFDKYIGGVLRSINFPSILLDKSCSDLMYQSRIKHVLSNNGKAAVCDEEGVNNITNNYAGLKARFDPNCAASISKFFAWGKLDCDLATDAGIPQERVVMTGNPRCDLMNINGSKFYNKKASALNTIFGDFILINDNFVVERFDPNYSPPFRSHLSKQENIELKAKRDKKIKENKLQRERLLELLMDLSQKYPDINFVIRPHPMSDPAYMHEKFSKVRNVFVVYKDSIEPWLFACRAMVSSGCTTALQAAIAKKPIYHFPSVGDHLEPLASSLGIEFSVSTNLRDYPESIVESNYKSVSEYINILDQATDNISQELFQLESQNMHINLDFNMFSLLSKKVVEQQPSPVEPKWSRSGYSVSSVRKIVQNMVESFSISCGKISIIKISPYLFILSNGY